MLLQTYQTVPVQTTPVQTVPVQVEDKSFADTIGDSLRESLDLVLGAIPRILGLIVIVAIDWFVSSLLARRGGGQLRAIRLEELMRRSGLGEFVAMMVMGTETGT